MSRMGGLKIHTRSKKMRIHIKGCYTILGRTYIASNQEQYELVVPFQDKSPVKIIIKSNESV